MWGWFTPGLCLVCVVQCRCAVEGEAVVAGDVAGVEEGAEHVGLGVVVGDVEGGVGGEDEFEVFECSVVAGVEGAWRNHRLVLSGWSSSTR